MNQQSTGVPRNGKFNTRLCSLAKDVLVGTSGLLLVAGGTCSRRSKTQSVGNRLAS